MTDVAYRYQYHYLFKTSELLADVPLEDLVGSAAFEGVRLRAKEIVLRAVREGEIEKPAVLDEAHARRELFSHLLARVLVSCVGDPFLLRRYATAEAKAAYRQMLADFYSGAGRELVHRLSEDLGVHVVFDGGAVVRVHFTDYLRLASGMRDEKWKLVNRCLSKGWVRVSLEDLARLLQEAVRERALEGASLPVDARVCEALRPYSEEIKRELERRRAAWGGGEPRAGVDEDCFPPCISELLRHIRSGMSVPHPARFAVTSFLLNLGVSVEDIVATFANLPDFDEEKTRYQVEHIAGIRGNRKKYSPPSCDTMRTYGNCFRNAECEGVSHPLAYYERKLREKLKRRGRGGGASGEASVRSSRRRPADADGESAATRVAR